MRSLSLLLALLFLQSARIQAADQKTLALAETMGAYSAALLFSTYVSLYDLQTQAKGGGKDTVTEVQITRHLAVLKVMDGTNSKLKTALHDDQEAVAFLNRIEEVNHLLRDEGEGLKSYLKSGAKADLETIQTNGGKARSLIQALMKLPDNRDIIP